MRTENPEVNMRAARATAVGFLALLALPACGGGGGGGDEATDTTVDPATTPSTVAAASAPAAPPPVSGGQVEGGLSKAEYISRADAVCGELIDRVEDDLDVEGEEPTREALLMIVQSLSVEFSGMVRRLEALPLPAGDTSGALAMIDRTRRIARSLRQLNLTLRREGQAALIRLEGIAARSLVDGAFANVYGTDYGFRRCTGDPVPSPAPELDRAVQQDLRNALTVQKTLFIDRQVFTEKIVLLNEAEPDLVFVRSLEDLTTGPGVVYVELADSRSLYLGAMSPTGNCFWVRDVEPAEGSDGEEQAESTYSSSESCSNRPAALTFVGNPLDGSAWPSVPPSEGEAEESQQASFD